jgi:uncharacterized membrane protein YraQ (UPF0718 family)
MGLKIILLRLLIAIIVSQLVAYLFYYFFGDKYFTSLFVVSILVVYASNFRKSNKR